MNFDPDNIVNRLCAMGMEQEGLGEPEEAERLFYQAWQVASTNLEQLTAAHYVARHQKSISDKLKWDETALKHALTAGDEPLEEMLPSLYLNVGKCHEDLCDYRSANFNYEAASSFSRFLPEDGYGNMIRSGINTALGRIQKKMESEEI